MFWNLFWPIALITLANCFYNICTKSTPEQANPFLSLCVTYVNFQRFSTPYPEVA